MSLEASLALSPPRPLVASEFGLPALAAPDPTRAALAIATDAEQAQKSATTRVAIIEDQLLIRLGLCALLAQDDAVTVVVDDPHSDECYRDIAARDAQVVIVNAEQRVDGMGTIIGRLRQFSPTLAIVALADDEDPERILEAFHDGANAFLPRSASKEELSEAIRVAAAGRSYLRPGAAGPLASRLRDATHAVKITTAPSTLLSLLSERERAVLTLIARGFSGPQIALQLGIATKTVDTYRHRIREKTGLHDRAEFVRMAMDTGLMS